MNMKIFTAVGIISIMTGCATAYQPKGLSGGFEETPLDANVWRVSFRGNGYTKSERAEDFALLRSAELALANGFTHFAFYDSKVGQDVSAYTAPTTSYTTGTVSGYGNTAYGNATTTTYGGGTTFIRKPAAVNIVVMFKEKPSTANQMIYDANFICSSLGVKYKVICNGQQ